MKRAFQRNLSEGPTHPPSMLKFWLACWLVWTPGRQLSSGLGCDDQILTVWLLEHLLHGLPLGEIWGMTSPHWPQEVYNRADVNSLCQGWVAP